MEKCVYMSLKTNAFIAENVCPIKLNISSKNNILAPTVI